MFYIWRKIRTPTKLSILNLLICMCSRWSQDLDTHTLASEGMMGVPVFCPEKTWVSWFSLDFWTKQPDLRVVDNF